MKIIELNHMVLLIVVTCIKEQFYNQPILYQMYSNNMNNIPIRAKLGQSYGFVQSVNIDHEVHGCKPYNMQLNVTPYLAMQHANQYTTILFDDQSNTLIIVKELEMELHTMIFDKQTMNSQLIDVNVTTIPIIIDQPSIITLNQSHVIIISQDQLQAINITNTTQQQTIQNTFKQQLNWVWSSLNTIIRIYDNEFAHIQTLTTDQFNISTFANTTIRKGASYNLIMMVPNVGVMEISFDRQISKLQARIKLLNPNIVMYAEHQFQHISLFQDRFINNNMTFYEYWDDILYHNDYLFKISKHGVQSVQMQFMNSSSYSAYFYQHNITAIFMTNKFQQQKYIIGISKEQIVYHRLQSQEAYIQCQNLENDVTINYKAYADRCLIENNQQECTVTGSIQIQILEVYSDDLTTIEVIIISFAVMFIILALISLCLQCKVVMLTKQAQEAMNDKQIIELQSGLDKSELVIISV